MADYIPYVFVRGARAGDPQSLAVKNSSCVFIPPDHILTQSLKMHKYTKRDSKLMHLCIDLHEGVVMKLLIVDDSAIMRRAIEKYLATKRFTLVGTAEDGENALRMFSKFLPDLVTMDITMPKMDGLTCLEKMLLIKPDTRILVVSALKDPVTGLQALKKGAKGFLPKPFTAAELQREVEELLRNQT
jgi:two-component system chemotaxis response regulator CheY